MEIIIGILKTLAFLSLFGLLVLVNIRNRINIKLYNKEYGTDYKPYSFFKFQQTKLEEIACIFTFWYSNVRPENKRLARKHNLVIILIGLCVLFIIIGGKLE